MTAIDRRIEEVPGVDLPTGPGPWWRRWITRGWNDPANNGQLREEIVQVEADAAGRMRWIANEAHLLCSGWRCRWMRVQPGDELLGKTAHKISGFSKELALTWDGYDEDDPTSYFCPSRAVRIAARGVAGIDLDDAAYPAYLANLNRAMKEAKGRG